MTPTHQAAEAYRRTAVQSASPAQLIVMLYDGALRFLSEAKDAAAAGNISARVHAISKVMNIVTECQNTLNMEEGGKIARDLDNLYSYMVNRLLDVGIKRDMTAIDEVHKLLSTLREGWSEVATQVTTPVVAAARPTAGAAVGARP